MAYLMILSVPQTTSFELYNDKSIKDYREHLRSGKNLIWGTEANHN